MPILSFLIFLPVLASILVAVLPDSYKSQFRWIALIVTGLQLAGCIWVFTNFDRQSSDIQFLEQQDWITLSLGSLGTVSIDYLIGLDGVSMPMALLTGLVMFIGAISSFEIKQKEKAYFSLYLLLSGSVMGCFLALDFFLFYLFFEFMLLPMYFLIGLWGGPRREYASLKFFIYTLFGSIFILIVMIGLYFSVIDPYETAIHAGFIDVKSQMTPEIFGQIQELIKELKIAPEHMVHTFDMRLMTDSGNFLPQSLLSYVSGSTLFSVPARYLAFIFLMIGFAIKLPAVPVHTWLPDAHVEAPTPVSVVLAGILLKIGGYGFIRIAYSIFPDGAENFAVWIAAFGVLSIIYGAYNALAMNDLKKMIAYSSVSHMGFVMLGIASLTSEGINAALYQMFSHGILSSMLFLLVGVLYDRVHDRRIDSYRGLAVKMPVFTAFVAIAFFASLGLPAFSGFIGEFFSLMGAFNSPFLPKIFAVLGAFGIVLGAGYFLWALQKMFFGKFWVREHEELLTDLNFREKIMLTPLAILAFVFGILPHLLFDITSPTISEFMKLWIK